jgi:THO complex subunit 3
MVKVTTRQSALREGMTDIRPKRRFSLHFVSITTCRHRLHHFRFTPHLPDGCAARLSDASDIRAQLSPREPLQHGSGSGSGPDRCGTRCPSAMSCDPKPPTARSVQFSGLSTRVVVGHTKAVTALAWTCSGDKLVAGGDGGHGVTLRVFDTERLSARDLHGDRDSDSYTGHSEPVEAIAASPVQPNLFASAGVDRVVNMYDMRVTGGAPVGSVAIAQPAVSMAWAPRGDYIVVGDREDKLYVIDAEKRVTVRRVPRADSVVVNQIRWTVDSTKMLQTCGDGIVRIYAWPNMRLLHELRGHSDACYGLAVDPTGHRVAVASTDATVSVWDATTLTSSFCIDRAELAVRLVDYSFDGNFLASASVAGNIDVTAAESGAYVHSIPTPNYRVAAMQWHPKRTILAYCLEEDPRRPLPPPAAARHYNPAPAPVAPMQSRTFIYGFPASPPGAGNGSSGSGYAAAAGNGFPSGVAGGSNGFQSGGGMIGGYQAAPSGARRAAVGR